MMKFVWQLPENIQAKIKHDLLIAGIKGADLYSAMNGRLCDLDDTIDITKYKEVATMKTREYYNIVELLIMSGYPNTAEDENYVLAVIDDLDAMGDPEYTIFDWLKDTEELYPEHLK